MSLHAIPLKQSEIGIKRDVENVLSPTLGRVCVRKTFRVVQKSRKFESHAEILREGELM